METKGNGTFKKGTYKGWCPFLKEWKQGELYVKDNGTQYIVTEEREPFQPELRCAYRCENVSPINNKVMKLAIIGSRNAGAIDIAQYVQDQPSEIVSGGARGVDSYAAQYAKANNIPLTVFRPNYKAHLQGAPIRRNEEIVKYADKVLAFWDGASRGTLYTINYAKKQGKPVQVVRI